MYGRPMDPVDRTTNMVFEEVFQTSYFKADRETMKSKGNFYKAIISKNRIETSTHDP